MRCSSHSLEVLDTSIPDISAIVKEDPEGGFSFSLMSAKDDSIFYQERGFATADGAGDAALEYVRRNESRLLYQEVYSRQTEGAAMASKNAHYLGEIEWQGKDYQVYVEEDRDGEWEWRIEDEDGTFLDAETGFASSAQAISAFEESVWNDDKFVEARTAAWEQEYDGSMHQTVDLGTLGKVQLTATGNTWYVYSWDMDKEIDGGFCDSIEDGMRLCEQVLEALSAEASKQAAYDWIDDLTLDDFDTEPTRGEDSYKLERDGLHLIIECINYGLWWPWFWQEGGVTVKAEDDFDNPYDALEELQFLLWDVRGASKEAEQSHEEKKGANLRRRENYKSMFASLKSAGLESFDHEYDSEYTKETDKVFVCISRSDGYDGAPGWHWVVENVQDLWDVNSPAYNGEPQVVDENFEVSGFPSAEDAYADLVAHADEVAEKIICQPNEIIASFMHVAWHLQDGGQWATCKYDDPSGYGDDKFGYADQDGYWEITSKGGMVLVQDDSASSLEEAMDACDEHARFMEYTAKMAGQVTNDGNFAIGDIYEYWPGGPVFEITEIDGNSVFLECEGDPDFPLWTESDELRRELEDNGVYASRKTAGDLDWRYDADDYYQFLSENELSDDSWKQIDGCYLIRVDDSILAVEPQGGEWSIAAYDEGSYDTLLWGAERIPGNFATPQDAVDWANDAINWIGDHGLPKIASKAAPFSIASKTAWVAKGETWDEFLADFARKSLLYTYTIPKGVPSKWIYPIDQLGNEYECEVTQYSDGDFECHDYNCRKLGGRKAAKYEWIDDLELSDFEATPTRGEDSYELHRDGLDLYVTCISYGMWSPKLGYPGSDEIGLINSPLDFDNPYDALEELIDMVYVAMNKYGGRRVKSAAAEWEYGVTDFVTGTTGYTLEQDGIKCIIEPESNGNANSWYCYLYEPGQADFSWTNWYETLDEAKENCEEQLAEYKEGSRKMAGISEDDLYYQDDMYRFDADDISGFVAESPSNGWEYYVYSYEKGELSDGGFASKGEALDAMNADIAKYNGKETFYASRKADRADDLQALYQEYMATYGHVLSQESADAIGHFLDWLYETGKKASREAMTGAELNERYMVPFLAWCEDNGLPGDSYREGVGQFLVFADETWRLASKQAGAFGPGSDKIDELRELMGDAAVLDAMMQYFSEDELVRCAESIATDWDYELTASSKNAGYSRELFDEFMDYANGHPMLSGKDEGYKRTFFKGADEALQWAGQQGRLASRKTAQEILYDYEMIPTLEDAKNSLNGLRSALERNGGVPIECEVYFDAIGHCIGKAIKRYDAFAKVGSRKTAALDWYQDSGAFIDDSDNYVGEVCWTADVDDITYHVIDCNGSYAVGYTDWEDFYSPYNSVIESGIGSEDEAKQYLQTWTGASRKVALMGDDGLVKGGSKLAISNDDYVQVIRDLDSRFPREKYHAEIADLGFRDTFSLGINWASIGAVTTTEAREFANGLVEMADAIDALPYTVGEPVDFEASRKKASWDWVADDAFSGAPSHIDGQYAYALAAPGEYYDDGWCVQVFDLDDEEALMYGELFEEFGPFDSEDEAKQYAENNKLGSRKTANTSGNGTTPGGISYEARVPTGFVNGSFFMKPADKYEFEDFVDSVGLDAAAISQYIVDNKLYNVFSEFDGTVLRDNGTELAIQLNPEGSVLKLTKEASRKRASIDSSIYADIVQNTYLAMQDYLEDGYGDSDPWVECGILADSVADILNVQLDEDEREEIIGIVMDELGHDGLV